jgi:hypothetical protein
MLIKKQKNCNVSRQYRQVPACVQQGMLCPETVLKALDLPKIYETSLR